jgi:CheY-like chemotaxis protein
MESLNLRNLIEATLDLIVASASAKNLELSYHIQPEVPNYIISDGTRLRQILVNLLNNAVKFTHKGSIELLVQLHSCKLNLDNTNIISPNNNQNNNENCIYEIMFLVKDTGIGIPTNRYERLFKPFSQVDSSHTREYGGTGLGLAISRNLAQLMGGEMTFSSQEGVGSTFSFTVTAESTSQVNQTEVWEKEDNLAGKKLLFISQENLNFISISNLIKKLNMQLIHTQSSSEAIVILQESLSESANQKESHRSQKIDLVLADVTIEEMAKIRAIFPALPMILLTNNLATNNHHKGDLADQFTAYIAKPIKYHALFKALIELHNLHDSQKSTAKETQSVFNQDFAAHYPLHILLAEDNIVNQKVVVRFLNRLGYQPDLVGNGLQAINALQEKSYNLILMDIHMPEMDGLTATKEIHDLWQNSQLKQAKLPWIVALTANAIEGDRETCLAVGMHDYLSKPLNINDLVAVLKRAITQNQ